MKKRVWTMQRDVEEGLGQLLEFYDIEGIVHGAHIIGTPERFTKALLEMFDGVGKKPKDVLSTLFPVNGNQEMIHVEDMTFFSTCSHHLLPFFGRAYFAYIPNEAIVGLSKIPRLVEMYAHRPQVQEEFTSQVVDAFQEFVAPQGCALMIRAYHMCCMSRGIKQPTSSMKTTALRGIFTKPDVKAEFLSSANSRDWKIF